MLLNRKRKKQLNLKFHCNTFIGLKELIKRTVTGAVIVIFVLGGFWLHYVSFYLTGLVVLVGAQLEYYRMIKNTGVNPQIVTGIIAGIITYSLSTLIASGLLPMDCLVLVIPVLVIAMITELYRKQAKPFESLAYTFFPLAYVVLPISLFPFSAFLETGLKPLIAHEAVVFSPGIVLGFFVLLWTNDTFAYLVGTAIGKHRLMERISPKKSWEGFFGGLVCTLLVAWLISGWLGVVSTNIWLLIAVIVSVIGTYGDLTESLLKRSMGVKDSGTIMPGHGGFLDRFDSSLLSFPIVYLVFLFLG